MVGFFGAPAALPGGLVGDVERLAIESNQIELRSRIFFNIAETRTSIKATNFGVHVAIEKIPYLDISTALDEATFWSGKGNRRLAESYANITAKRTIEMTSGGQYLESLNLFNRFSGKQAIIPWERLSLRFAQSASGNVSAFVEGARPESIFTRIEYPALLENLKVTNIIFSPEYEKINVYRPYS